MDIKDIINEETTPIDVEKLELPESMQQPDQAEAAADTQEHEEKTTKLSLEQLAGIIMVGYNAISCTIYRRIEPEFDASLTAEETQAIQKPLETVLQEYNVEVTPVTALVIAVVGVNIAKVFQLQQFRQLKMQELQQQEAEQQNVNAVVEQKI